MYNNDALRYEGGDPYLFIASCEEDNEMVVPILEKFFKEYRIWFPWKNASPKEDSESIARHILDSAGCIAFITPKALGLHTFRREVCYAREKGKPFLALFMEDVDLTPGMEMELSDAKRLTYSEYRGQEQVFFFHIRMTDFVRAAEITFYPSDPAKTIPPAGLNEPDTIPSDRVPAVPPVFKGQPTALGGKETPGRDFPPMYLEPVGAVPGEMDDTLLQPLPEERAPFGRAWLVRKRTGEEIPLAAEKPLCLGRSPEDCGYAISGNSAISKQHARVFCREGSFYALDLGSFNRTYVNDMPLQPELPRILRDGDLLRLANEGFIFRQETKGDGV